MPELGPRQPMPRQNLLAGLVLYAADGESEIGVITEVRHVTEVVLEDGSHVVYSDDEPVPIVAPQLPDPPPVADLRADPVVVDLPVELPAAEA